MIVYISPEVERCYVKHHLFCLFSLYLCLRIQSSLLAPNHSQPNCISATVNEIVDFVYHVVQFIFHVQDPPRFLLLTLEPKGLSLIHVDNYENVCHQSHL